MSANKDIVIFLPGIGGTALLHEGKEVWGGARSTLYRILTKQSLEKLKITEDTGKEDLGDGIVVGGIIDAVHLIPGLWKIDAYTDFCSQLCRDAKLTDGKNFFQFPYDWRRDNRVTARRLQAFVDARLHAWRKESGNPDARVILVAHSMGGLVSRYFIECLEGWRSVRRLITLGTPHRGSLMALGFLVNGYAKKIGPVNVDATSPLRSFPSVYQLLPTFRCVSIERKLCDIKSLKLPELNTKCLQDAVGFHEEIESCAQANKGLEGYSESYLSPYISSLQPTFQSAKQNIDGKLELLQAIGGENSGGDGTVPTGCGVPIGMDLTQATYVGGIHATLTGQAALRESIAGVVMASTINQELFRAGRKRAEVTVDLDDVYLANEEFEFKADVRGGTEQSLTVMATPVDGGPPKKTTLYKRKQGPFVGPLKLEPGAWRIRVSGQSADAVEDVVLAMGPDGAI